MLLVSQMANSEDLAPAPVKTPSGRISVYEDENVDHFKGPATAFANCMYSHDCFYSQRILYLLRLLYGGVSEFQARCSARSHSRDDPVSQLL